MAEKEQVRPLAPSASRRVLHIEGQDQLAASPASMKVPNRKKKKCLKCCGCICALILILAVIVITLAFTVFHVEDPTLAMNSVKIDDLNLGFWSDSILPIAYLTLIVDTTTNLYYDGMVVGVAVTPLGNARARRTLRMNVTVHVLVDRILTARRLESDLITGFLPVSSYTRIDGKVKILKIVKKDVVVKMNCTMTVDTRSQSVRDQSCKRDVSL